MVPSHCFLAAILTSFSFMATNGQSAAVAAQYMLSGQQNQFCSGQHPAGHTVPSHCFLAAILTSFSFMATNGQSAAVAAQYMLSGQQNQFCSGQHPDNMYCAATAADCPFVAMKEKLVKMAAKKQCDGTVCPGAGVVVKSVHSIVILP